MGARGRAAIESLTEARVFGAGGGCGLVVWCDVGGEQRWLVGGFGGIEREAEFFGCYREALTFIVEDELHASTTL